MKGMFEKYYNTAGYTLIILIIILFRTISFADTITVGTGGWMPYFATTGNEPPGYTIEMVRTILNKAGHSLTIKNIPYIRAMKMLYEGSLNLIIGSRIDELDPEKVAIVSEEIGINVFVFYVKRENKWQYEDVRSLRNMKLGLVIGETYPGLESYIAENRNMIQFIASDDAYERNLKKLVAGRVDVITDNENVIDYYASMNGVTAEIRKAGYLTKPEKLFAAFSRKHPRSDEYSKLLSEGISKMRESGDLQNLLSRYGLKDWK